MKKIIKVTIFAVLLVFALGIGASAAEEGQQIIIGDSVANINILKLIDNTDGLSKVTVQILYPEKEAPLLGQFSDLSGIYAYYDEIGISSDGTLTCSVKLEKSGKYVLVIGGDSLSESVTQNLIYIDSAANAAVLGELNNVDATAIKEIIGDSQKLCDLGIYTDMYSVELIDDAAKLLVGHTFDTTKGVEEAATICKSFFVAAINNGNSINVNDYVNEIGLDTVDYYKWYKPAKSANINSILEKQKYSTLSNFDTALEEAVVLTAVRYPDGMGEVKDIVKAYVGSNLSISSSDYQKLAGAKFATFDDFKTTAAGYASSTSNTDKESSSRNPGFGSGASSGGYVRSIVVDDETNVTNNENLSIPSRFNDMSDYAWAQDAVEQLALKGVVAGKGDNKFHPSDNVLREEFVKMLVEAFKLNVVGDELPFDDVLSSDWYYSYINTSYYSGIVKGISDNIFGSGNCITRQQMTAMVYNALSVKGVTLPTVNDKINFTDELETDDYARNALTTLQRANIIVGNENGEFMPNGNATRAEAAKVIYMLLGYIN